MLAKAAVLLLVSAALFAASPVAAAEPAGGAAGAAVHDSQAGAEARCVGLPCDLVNIVCQAVKGRPCVR